MLFTSLGRSELGKTVSGVSILSAALADGGTKDFPMGTPGWVCFGKIYTCLYEYTRFLKCCSLKVYTIFLFFQNYINLRKKKGF